MPSESEPTYALSVETDLFEVHKYLHRSLYQEKCQLREKCKEECDTEEIERQIQTCYDVWQQYMAACEPLLKQHATLSERILGIGPRWQQDGLRNLHLNVIQEYFNLVGQFFNITCYYTADMATNATGCCPSCASTNLHMDEDVEYCADCGLTMSEKVTIRQSDLKYKPASIEDDVTYDAMVDRALKVVTLPPDINLKLDEWFVREGYLPSAAVIQQNLAMTEPYTLEKLIVALKACNYTRFYRQLNSVLDAYWKVPPPDLEHIRETVRPWYHATCLLWQQHKPPGRNSKPNTAYHLFRLWEHAWLIKLIDIEIKPTMFKMPVSTEVLTTHDTVFSQMYRVLNWEFRPLAHKKQSDSKEKGRRKRNPNR